MEVAGGEGTNKGSVFIWGYLLFMIHLLARFIVEEQLDRLKPLFVLVSGPLLLLVRLSVILHMSDRLKQNAEHGKGENILVKQKYSDRKR